jgi:hypothetical protein
LSGASVDQSAAHQRFRHYLGANFDNPFHSHGISAPRFHFHFNP